MKDLKAFFEDLATNESLADKFEGVKETSKIVEIARAEGYEFTKKEYNDVMLAMVSGGVNLSQSKRDIGALIMEKYLTGTLSETSEQKAKDIQQRVIYYGNQER